MTLGVSVERISSDGGLLRAAVRAAEDKYNIKFKNDIADGGTVNINAIEAQERRAEPVMGHSGRMIGASFAGSSSAEAQGKARQSAAAPPAALQRRCTGRGALHGLRALPVGR